MHGDQYNNGHLPLFYMYFDPLLNDHWKVQAAGNLYSTTSSTFRSTPGPVHTIQTEKRAQVAQRSGSPTTVGPTGRQPRCFPRRAARAFQLEWLHPVSRGQTIGPRRDQDQRSPHEEVTTYSDSTSGSRLGVRCACAGRVCGREFDRRACTSRSP